MPIQLLDAAHCNVGRCTVPGGANFPIPLKREGEGLTALGDALHLANGANRDRTAISVNFFSSFFLSVKTSPGNHPRSSLPVLHSQLLAIQTFRLIVFRSNQQGHNMIKLDWLYFS